MSVEFQGPGVKCGSPPHQGLRRSKALLFAGGQLRRQPRGRVAGAFLAPPRPAMMGFPGDQGSFSQCLSAFNPSLTASSALFGQVNPATLPIGPLHGSQRVDQANDRPLISLRQRYHLLKLLPHPPELRVRLERVRLRAFRPNSSSAVTRSALEISIKAEVGG